MGLLHLYALDQAGPFTWILLYSTTSPLTCSKSSTSLETEPGHSSGTLVGVGGPVLWVHNNVSYIFSP